MRPQGACGDLLALLVLALVPAAGLAPPQGARAGPVCVGKSVGPSTRKTSLRGPIPGGALRLRGGGGCLSTCRGGGENPFGGPGSSKLNATLLKAARKGDVTWAEALVHKGAHVNCSNEFEQTPLLKAAEGGSAEMMTRLIALGADLACMDNKGSSPMHYAAYNGHPECVEVLVGLGCKIQPLNVFGYTPLQYAAAQGETATVKKLVELGADVNFRNRANRTALHEAAENGFADTIAVLLSLGAKARFSQEGPEYTPLHDAVYLGHIDAVQVLIHGGADPWVQDQWGNTPMKLGKCAIDDGRSDLWEYLQTVADSQGSGEGHKDRQEATTEPKIKVCASDELPEWDD